MLQQFKNIFLLIILIFLSLNAHAKLHRTVAKQNYIYEIEKLELTGVKFDDGNLTAEEVKYIQFEEIPQIKQPIIGLDTINPYGYLPHTTFAFNVLESKNKLNNLLVLGAELELDLEKWSGSYNSPSFNYHTGSSVGLSNVELFFVGNFNSYLTGVVELQNNLPGYSVAVTSGFLNVGNLILSPFYLTVGKSYLPFGAFDGDAPWSNELTTNVFRTHVNQLTLGWYDYGFNVNAGVYQVNNDIKTNLGSYLFNFFYTKVWGKFGLNAGGGYISDIRGTNSSLGNAFTPLNVNGISQIIYSSPAMSVANANLALNFDKFWVNSEYVTTFRGANDSLNNNLNTGKLRAWMLGLTYTNVLFCFPTNIFLGYSRTYNLSDLPFPLNGAIISNFTTTPGAGMQKQWLAYYNSQVVTNVYIGPEFQYATLYNGENTWAGILDITAYF